MHYLFAGVGTSPGDDKLLSELTLSSVNRYLTGMIQSGSWGLLDNGCKLPLGNLNQCFFPSCILPFDGKWKQVTHMPCREMLG